MKDLTTFQKLSNLGYIFFRKSPKEEKGYYGIIYLRLKLPKLQNVIKALEKLLSLNIDLYPGNLVAVDNARVRIRMPERE